MIGKGSFGKVISNLKIFWYTSFVSSFTFSLDEDRKMIFFKLKFQVLLARHKAEEVFYAVKVLQKKAILKKKEV